MNKVYVYDGDFLSLLNLIYYLIDKNIRPSNIRDEDYNPNLFEEVIKLNVLNDNTIERYALNLGYSILRIIYYVYLSNNENKELILYYFCLNERKYGSNIIYRRDLKCVSEVLKISEYVSHETHKYKGFVRFKELENKVLYAEIEPVNNILFLISEHFAKRLNSEYWIIKDVRRNIISIYDKKEFIIVMDDEFVLATNMVSESENLVVDLWKTFYKTIGISERKNDRCRQNFMPKRYWKYIVEVSDEL